MAYAAITATIVNVVFRTGLVWIAASAGLAVLLGLAEIVIQIKNRGTSA